MSVGFQYTKLTPNTFVYMTGIYHAFFSIHIGYFGQRKNYRILSMSIYILVNSNNLNGRCTVHQMFYTFPFRTARKVKWIKCEITITVVLLGDVYYFIYDLVIMVRPDKLKYGACCQDCSNLVGSYCTKPKTRGPKKVRR